MSKIPNIPDDEIIPSHPKIIREDGKVMSREALVEIFYQDTPVQVGTGAALGYAEKCADRAMSYLQDVVKYTLEQAAEKGSTTSVKVDSLTVKVGEIDKQSILSLESQIIKDLGL